jgi:hypothetical protein
MMASVNPGMACESATVASPLTARSNESVTEEILSTVLNSCRSLAQKKEPKTIARELGELATDGERSIITVNPAQPFLSRVSVQFLDDPFSTSITLTFKENIALDIDAWRNQFKEAKPAPILHPIPWKYLLFYSRLPGPSGLDKCFVSVNYRDGEQGIRDATLFFMTIHAEIWE